MKIDLLDIDQFIIDNNCGEVTNPVRFEAGALPTKSGIFSTTIFGELGTKERQRKFGYINLNSNFLHPIIYQTLRSLDRRTPDIIGGSLFVSLDARGYIVEDDVNGSTGLNFYYSNWDKIRYKVTDSKIRETKLNLLRNTPKKLVFTNKTLVLPAYLRDFNVGSGNKADDADAINDVYDKIIRLSRNLTSASFGFVANHTMFQIQEALMEIYEDFVIDKVSGRPNKRGLFRRALLGKNVDYATRSVISAPDMYSDTYKELEIPFGYSGIPLSQLIVIFYPFFTKYISDFVDLHRSEFENVTDSKGRVATVTNVKDQFNDSSIKLLLDNYIRNIEGRYDRIRVKADDGKLYPVRIFSDSLGRDFTITDLLYIAAVDITEDKHVYITRYPVGNYRSQRFSEIY